MPGAEGRAEVLVVDSVGRSFGDRAVLKAASFRVHAGEILCLMGRNGEGKTTLLRVAAGLLGPDHGFVRFGGKVHLRPRLHRLARRGLLYLSQDAPLPATLSIRHALRAMARMGDSESSTGESTEARLEIEAEALALMPLLDRNARSLSGGERSRAAAAAALLRQPVCVLFDEPLAGSSPKDRELLSVALSRLAAQGCAVVVTGHDVDDLLALAHRVVWVASGTTLDLGPPDTARRHDLFRRHYLGMVPRAGS